MRSFWLIAALVLFGVVEVWCYNNIAYAIGERRFGCSDCRWTLVWLCSNYNLEIILKIFSGPSKCLGFGYYGGGFWIHALFGIYWSLWEFVTLV